MALGSALANWGMKANRFFSSYVRIQTDRGHQVVEGSPYACLRHPGYAGAILFTLGTPILLNSIPAFVLDVITTLIILLRTFLEDRTLRQELPGYQQYAQTVRYRLLPLVW
jgi:protein-S-isoprenylcysteine O-methyltransferase Ste14